MLEPLDGPAARWIGPYQLLARLGAGGMGEVHLARPVRHGPPLDVPHGLIAVKTVRSDLDLDREFRVRFRREVTAARAVRGPHTAELVAAEPDAQPPWLATRYVAGPPLHEAVRRGGPLSVETVLALGADLARALRAIHGARLLHRDLKPANVLLAADGPKVIDFGLAHAFDATALTATGLVVGTPAFMSPEHVRDTGEISTASDVFCLGSLLCFAATGRGPFHDPELAAVLHRIAQGEADLTGLPEALAGTVAACLDPDPRSRPRTDELIRILGGEREPDPEVPFPWPPSVLELIGESVDAVRAVVAQAPLPPPTAAPGPPPGPPPGSLPPPPEWSVPPSDARRAGTAGVPPAGTAVEPHAATAGVPRVGAAGVPVGGADARPARRSLQLRITLSALVGVVAGALVALLLPWLGVGEDEGPTDRGSTDQVAGTRGDEPAPVVYESGLSYGDTDFGARATDPDQRPAGWRPWRVTGSRAAGCALTPDALLCGTGDGLHARDLATGELRWRYPERSGGRGGTLLPTVLGDRVYTVSPAGGVAVVRLSDGREIQRFPAAEGYGLARIAVGDGRVFAGFVGPAGVNTASSMLFRAYREEDGAQLWEADEPASYPQTLELVGGHLQVQGTIRSVAMDARTGRVLAEAEPCMLHGTPGDALLCPSHDTSGTAVRDADSLRDGRRLPLDVEAVSDSGIALGTTPYADRQGGPPSLLAVRVATGEVLWSRPLPEEESAPGSDRFLLMGDEFLEVREYDVRRYSLTDGRPLGGRKTYAGWPRNTPNTSYRPLAMAVGGVLYLVFMDGTVISAELP